MITTSLSLFKNKSNTSVLHGPVFCMAHVSNWRTAQCRKRIGMRMKKSLLAWVTNPSNTSHHCTYTAAATNDASLAEICIMYSPSIRQVPSLGMVDSAVAIAQWFLACLQCVNCVSLSDNMNAIKNFSEEKWAFICCSCHRIGLKRSHCIEMFDTVCDHALLQAGCSHDIDY